MKRKFLYSLFTVVFAVCMAFTLSGCVTECTSHTEKWIEDKAATCSEQGIKHSECEICGKYLGAENIPMLEHNFVDYACTLCGTSAGTEGLAYIENGDGYILTGIGSASENDIIVPATYKDLPVISIADEAFYQKNTITSVVILNGVTHIGNSSFYGCTSLTSIIIPNSVTGIGNSAFSGCTSLTNVTIPNSVTSIGNSAFSRCTSLTSVIISNGVTSIESTFSGCASLTSVIIPNSVTNIGFETFSGCTSLTNITIPNSVTSIGGGAFSRCSSLTNITIPNGVTSIDMHVFDGCTSLTSINVDSDNLNYKSIGGNLYSKDGTELIRYAIGKTNSSFTIPNSVVRVGVMALYGCTSLTSIIIPNSVTSFGSFALDGCSSLTTIYCEALSQPSSWGNYPWLDKVVWGYIGQND